ncbi:ABC transporter substrate-binding protein [Bisgaard Taxon 45]
MFSYHFNHAIKRILLSVLLIVSPLVHSKTIEDAKGNTIDIPDQVTRIAGLWHANNQIILLLGGADKLVATTTVIQKHPWFNQIYPRIKTVPALTNGQTIQMEELLQQRPDVALISSGSMQEELTKAGIKPVMVMFQDFEGLKKTVQITANVIGDNAPQIAEQYIQELEDNIAFVEKRTQSLAEKEKPVVLHIANSNNLLKVDGGKSIIGDWITKAGGRNALPEQANLVEVSMEAILKANPDVIIIGSANAADGIKKIHSDPVWQNISAVKQQRVYVNPMGTFPWDRYSAEEALQVLWAAQKFHPTLFQDLDMIEKTQNFYKKYYHYDLSKENAQQILHGLDPLP